MKSRLLLVIVILCTMLSMLFSCQFPIGPVTPSEDEKKVYSRIVYADDTLDLIPVRSALGEIMDAIISVTPDSETPIDGEVAFGDTNRAVTAAAKNALSKELKKADDCDAGYIIYSDDKSIAVYWNNEDLSEIAIHRFITDFLSGKEFKIDDGTASVGLYSSYDIEREAAWAKLESELDPGVYSALRELYEYYDGAAIAGWVANLYDPEIGGFYYSISARDYEPFRPDLESTTQALGIMDRGKGGFNRNTDLPESIKADIVAFIKSTQSPKDGYFYHPQWPQDKALLQTDRYGRDVGWATNMLKSFTLDTDGDGVQEQQYPNYCILSSKCEKHTGTDDRCTFPIADLQAVTSRTLGEQGLTDTVGLGVSAAVSKVKSLADNVIAAAAVSSHPDYSSPEAFREWLYAYNNEELLRKSSGKAHNLAALHNEIVSHGMHNIVMDQLDAFQEMLFEEQQASGVTPTGAWQETADYNAVWGMYKYITTFYNGSTGRGIDPLYIPYMIRTAIEVIKSPAPENFHMNDIMNQWTCIADIISNAKRHNPDIVESLYEIVREDAVGVIEHTVDKMSTFKIADGSIGYSPTGNSNTTMYGVPISVGMVEGDTNAVNLCINTYSAIFRCLGYTEVPLMTRADVDLFIEEITTLEPIVKTEPELQIYDFESGEPQGFRWEPGDNGGKVEIVTDPEDSSNMVLVIDSPVGQTNSDRVKIPQSNLGGNCYIFESDIYVERCTVQDYMMQLYMGRMYMVSLHKSGNNVLIRETPDDNRAIHTTIATVPMNEWFNLRIEYYGVDAIEDEDATLPIIKVFVNGEFKYSSSNYMYINRGNEPNKIYYPDIYSIRGSDNRVYFDNCYFTTENKMYNPDDHTISDARDDM